MSATKFGESCSAALASVKSCRGFSVSSFHNIRPLSYTEESVKGKSAGRWCEAVGSNRQDCVYFCSPKSSLSKSGEQIFLFLFLFSFPQINLFPCETKSPTTNVYLIFISRQLRHDGASLWIQKWGAVIPRCETLEWLGNIGRWEIKEEEGL